MAVIVKRGFIPWTATARMASIAAVRTSESESLSLAIISAGTFDSTIFALMSSGGDQLVFVVHGGAYRSPQCSQLL